MMATEKRLIDARAGKKLFCAIAKPAEYNGVIHLVVPISEIDKLPTVDALEVVHGHWELIPNHDALGYCSECKYKPAFVSYKYCPNCGADMRERKEND